MADLVATLTAMAADSVEPELRAVTVTTMHGAKGREWDVVFLPHLVEGVIPSLRARSGSALDEERRLLYVAFTRARSRLFLSWHERGPRGTARSPSSLLPEGVVDEAQQHDPGRRPSVAGGRGGVRARRIPH